MAKKRLADSTVLITGAGGFIGSHLCELCLSEGAQVRAFVHYNSRNDWGMLETLDRRKLLRLQIQAGDLRDPEAVRRAVEGCDFVFHLGALIGIPYSYVNPADVVATNVLGTLHVLAAAREFCVRRVIQTSTSEVYGSARYVPMDEDHPLSPQSPYAASKVGSDMLALGYHRTYDLPVVVLRPFNAFGPRQSPRAVIPAIILQALKSTCLRLGSAEPRRDWTYVTDTARGFICAALAAEAVGRVIQVGSNREVSVAQVVKMVGELLEKRLKIQVDKERVRPQSSEVDRLLAGNVRAREILGWAPRVSFEAGLRKTIAWYQRRPSTGKENLYSI